MKQTVGNACGTIGLLHAVGNLTSELKLGKFVKFSFQLCVLVIYVDSNMFSLSWGVKMLSEKSCM